MNLSKRQKSILNYLVHEDKFITAKELSGELNVSEKTIYREIKGIKDKSTNCNEVIVNHIGKGFKINYDVYVMHLRSLNGNVNRKHALSTEERREEILINLLFDSPEKTSINNLSELFMISSSSISKDICYIRELLGNTKVKLNSTNLGTYVVATELNLRMLIKNIVIKNITNNDYSYDLITLQKYFTYEDIDFTRELMANINAENNIIEDPYYINLFVYILVTIARLKKNHFLKSYDRCACMNYEVNENQEIASDIIKKISAYMMIVLNGNERDCIYSLISTSSISNLNESLTKDDNRDLKGEYLIDFLVNQMVRECSAKYFDNSELRRNLYAHVKLMISRINNNIKVHNPLLEEIEQECNFIFNSLKKIIHESQDFSYVKSISDDEVGYLTIYFQYFYEQHLQSLRVLIICSTGIGTSHLLKGRVLRSFPKWKIIDILSSAQINMVDQYADIDLVLTTVNLPDHRCHAPLVHVSTFLNERDIENILKITRRKDSEFMRI